MRSHFVEKDIEDYFDRSGFKMEFLDTRKPYDFELNVERIYAIGTKKN